MWCHTGHGRLLQGIELIWLEQAHVDVLLLCLELLVLLQQDLKLLLLSNSIHYGKEVGGQ